MASTVWLCLLTGTFGFFLAMAIADLGIRGVAVAFVGLLPQAFFLCGCGTMVPLLWQKQQTVPVTGM
ncbi:MAG: hypothetical protein ACLU6P_01480 [Roseburia intestinalis]